MVNMVDRHLSGHIQERKAMQPIDFPIKPHLQVAKPVVATDHRPYAMPHPSFRLFYKDAGFLVIGHQIEQSGLRQAHDYAPATVSLSSLSASA